MQNGETTGKDIFELKSSEMKIINVIFLFFATFGYAAGKIMRDFRS